MWVNFGYVEIEVFLEYLSRDVQEDNGIDLR